MTSDANMEFILKVCQLFFEFINIYYTIGIFDINFDLIPMNKLFSFSSIKILSVEYNIVKNY